MPVLALLVRNMHGRQYERQVAGNGPYHLSRPWRNMIQHVRQTQTAQLTPPKRASGTQKQLVCRARSVRRAAQCLQSRKRADWSIGPSFELSKEQAVRMQLQALSDNDKPYIDNGVEVMYRFASFDPFARSNYFGRMTDLGQFERFRRIFHTEAFRPLLGHVEHRILSTMQISEYHWRQRIWVKGFRNHEEGSYSFNLIQRFGGRYDGIWFTESLHADDSSSTRPYVV